MIYLDNAATTAVYPECAEIINKYNTEKYFNPSALYSQSAEVAKDIKKARENLLEHLGGNNGSLVFTASGTEADNIAFFCKSFKKNSRIVISGAEHTAVYNTAVYLRSKDYDVAVCPVDAYGRLDLKEFEKTVDERTAFVSVIHVSNETGAVNDIEKIVAISKKANPDCIVHSDGVQAFKKTAVNVGRFGVDLYSISGHKIHAPKGIGALYIKKGVNVNAFVHGGGQEYGIRSATENVSGIAAFSLAADIIGKKTVNKDLLISLKDFLTENFDIMVNTPNGGVGNILSVAFAGIKGEVLLRCLEEQGIIVGTGSACSAKKGTNRIAAALGLPSKYSEGILRFSINENTQSSEIEELKKKITAEGSKLLKFKPKHS
ncbi:MAG: cysteine desulfurase [Clostridiales bacterium]|jgi:cysteine desulfurase|nr:cysteine desulfurase [Clostridiales bacterium]